MVTQIRVPLAVCLGLGAVALLSGCGAQSAVSASHDGAVADSAANDHSDVRTGILEEIVWIGPGTDVDEWSVEAVHVYRAGRGRRLTVRSDERRKAVVKTFQRSDAATATIRTDWVEFVIDGKRHWIPRDDVRRVVFAAPKEPETGRGDATEAAGTAEATDASTETGHDHH